MSEKLCWGLLSTARVNRRIIKALSGSGRGRLYAVASRDPDRAKAYAAEHGIPKWHGDYDSLLKDPQVQVVYNSLPNSLHAEWTIKALEAGKHVLCEKPFAQTTEDANRVHDAAITSGKVVTDALMYRHHPKILKLKELIDEGAIGKPRSMLSSYASTLDRLDDVRWDFRLGGGCLWDLGLYPVSLALYLFGTPDRVQGRAIMTRGVDETFIGALLFSSGVHVNFDCSYRRRQAVHADIQGSEGSLMLANPFKPDMPEAQLLLRKGDSVEETMVANPELFGLEVEDIHDAILDGKTPLITPGFSRLLISTIQDLYRASKLAG